MAPEVHVLSAAGKPIFSTAANDQDDGAHASMSGLIQGISSFSKDALRVIKTKTTTLHFLPCHPLLFFCALPVDYAGASAYIVLQRCYVDGLGLNVPRLLLLIQHHVLFFLTENGLRLMETNPNYDLRNLLHGTEGLLASLARIWSSATWAQLDGIGLRVWPMADEARKTLQRAMDAPGLLFGLVLRDEYVLAYRQGHKDHPLPINDVHVLGHVVNHMTSFRSTESWTPICLPSFNRRGFVYAYIVFTSVDICTILISTNESQDQFHTFQTLHNNQISRALMHLLSCQPPLVADAPPSLASYLPAAYQPLLLHFIYQHAQSHQVVSPSFRDSAVFEDVTFQRQVLQHYHTLHQHLHSAGHRAETNRMGIPRAKDMAPSATTYFFRTDALLVMGRVLEKQAGFIYVCCEGLVSAEDADLICDRLVARIYQTGLYSL